MAIDATPTFVAGDVHYRPELELKFALSHKHQVDALIDANSRARFYPGLGATSSSLETAAMIEAFADQYLAVAAHQDSEVAAAGIRARVATKERRAPRIAAWLQQRLD